MSEEITYSHSKRTLGLIQKAIEKYSTDKYEFVFRNSPDYKRQMLNAIVSKILNVAIDDNFNISKTNNRALYYFELRILIFLRSNNFNENAFKSLVKEIHDSNDSSEYYHKVDLLLFEVLPIFKAYISDAKKIDSLIKVHQYVNGLWKNGSKFLHFYTLHNEEHSVELIKHSVKITKTIDYLKLKPDDYYILFLSCYLHDISMVLHPNLEYFAQDGKESDLIYSEWKRDVYELLGLDLSKATTNNKNVTQLENIGKSDIKQVILNYFRNIDEFFGNYVRANHAKQSAKFIKEQGDLSFIGKCLLQLVADVSEAHYYDAKDVYKIKSVAKDDLFNQKYLMIVLRLADLLDMSRERVSPNFMDQNIKYMSDISQYHWISHLSINSCHIESDFVSYKLEDVSDNKLIAENIKIVIHLNTSQLTKVEALECTKWCAILKSSDTKNSFISIRINDHFNNSKGKACDLDCNLSCKWFVDKQRYLFNELYELQRYLNRNENNIFRTSFNVELHFDNTDTLPQRYLDVIQSEIK